MSASRHRADEPVGQRPVGVEHVGALPLQRGQRLIGQPKSLPRKVQAHELYQSLADALLQAWTADSETQVIRRGQYHLIRDG